MECKWNSSQCRKLFNHFNAPAARSPSIAFSIYSVLVKNLSMALELVDGALAYSMRDNYFAHLNRLPQSLRICFGATSLDRLFCQSKNLETHNVRGKFWRYAGSFPRVAPLS
jgi:hypothetical protein